MAEDTPNGGGATPDGAGGFRSGFVTIVGRPNVGKSTLLNALLGEKVAIVTPKPQTTRDRIHGIRTDERSQIVFVDTPGIHKPWKKLNKAMVDRAVEALGDVDVVCLMVDATQQGDELPTGDRHVLEHVERAGRPTLLLVNKVDRLKRKAALLPIIERWTAAFDFAAVVPLSAREGDNVPRALEEIVARLPEGPRYYDDDQLTDRTSRFLVAEIIREKVTLRTEKEIPYAVAVEIERWKDRGGKFTEIDAVIHVERESQKGIVIGRRGAMLKTIGSEARADVERLLGHKVMLRLFVHVEPGWTEKNRGLKRFGYVD